MRRLPCSILICALGCAPAVHVERLRQLPVERVSADAQPLWEKQRVLVRRFADLRTHEFGKTFASGAIPVVNFVHVGGRLEYPDHSGLYSGEVRGKPIRRVGGLDTELPYLVAHALPGRDVVVEDDLRVDGEPQRFDWIVEGRVLQSTSTTHASFVLGMLSIVGMPMAFSRQELRVEIAVRKPGAAQPVLSRIYSFDGRRSEGLYYHHGSSSTLARRSVKQVVERAARDIVVAVADTRARELAAIPGSVAARRDEAEVGR